MPRRSARLRSSQTPEVCTRLSRTIGTLTDPEGVEDG